MMCVYIVLMHSEEECFSGQRLSKDHSWRIVEISWVLGSESLKKKIKHPLYHHMLFGRVSREILLAHPKTNSSKFSCQTRLELQMALASKVRWNWKNSFLAADPPDGFSTNRDKKYPMPTVKYTAGSLMLWACFSAGGPGYLVQMHGIMDSIKYQKIKNSKPDCLILSWAVVGSSIRTIIQNKHQNQHKTVSLSKKRNFCHGRPSPLTRTL